MDISDFSHDAYEVRQMDVTVERHKNRETRQTIGEVFGELAWQASQLFSETPEQGPGFSVKV